MTTSYLTAPNAEKTANRPGGNLQVASGGFAQRTYRYMCQLASNELELDRDGIPVPKDCQTVDVVVTEPGVEAITALIAATGWLSGYTMVSCWQPEDGCDCF